MLDNFKKVLVRQAHNTLRKMGLQLVGANTFFRSQDVVQLIRSKGREVSSIFDVGAFRGDWSLELARYLRKDVRFTLFEPSPGKALSLQTLCQQKDWNFLPVALGDFNGSRPFYAKGQTGDSFYREIGDSYKDSDLIEVEIRKLDDIVKIENLTVPEFMKLDCQGSELDILNGGPETVPKILAIVTETQLLVANQDSSNIIDVVNRFMELDFIPYSITEVHNRGGVLNQIDLLFLNTRFLD